MAQEFDITYSKRVDYVTRNVVAETKEEALKIFADLFKEGKLTIENEETLYCGVTDLFNDEFEDVYPRDVDELIVEA